MNIDYKNTYIKLKITPTTDNTGIINDIWYKINIYIKNNEINLKKEIAALTKKEIYKIIDLLTTFYNIPNKKSFIMKFIKNYITIRTYKNNKNNYLDINIIKIKSLNNKNYKLIFKNKEIENLTQLIINQIT